MIQSELTQPVLDELFARFRSLLGGSWDTPSLEDVNAAMDRDGAYRFTADGDVPATFCISREKQVLYFSYEYDLDAPSAQHDLHEERKEKYQQAVNDFLLDYIIG
ncbi:MAG: hypothetical protein HY341_00105 [Candidatus Kerfeldbacteria bacterium]|nr:hypothetical protein [Candidatus Kerfeldbacteria bacterium]